MNGYAKTTKLGEEYLAFIKHNPGCREPVNLREMDIPKVLQTYYSPLQHIPMVVDQNIVEELHNINFRTMDTIRRLPNLIFNNNADDLCRFYGFDQQDVLDKSLSGYQYDNTIVCRNDFTLTADGFKCLEVNCSTTLVGWNMPFYFNMYRHQLPIGKFFDGLDCDVRVRDTITCFIRFIARMARKMPSLRIEKDFNLAIVGLDNLDTAGTHRKRMVYDLFDKEMESMHIRGSVTDCGSLDEFSLIKDCLYVGGKRIHAVLTTASSEVCPAILEAYSAGNVFWPDNPLCHVYNDKLNFALLHQHKNNPVLTDDDRSFIENHIPKSWFFRNPQVQLDGENVPRDDYMRTHQDMLVLKDARGSQGENVFIGCRLSSKEWQRAIKMAKTKGDWLIQEYCESLPFMGQTDKGELANFDCVWGLFGFGDEYGGANARLKQQSAGTGVINIAKGAMEGIVLEVQS